MEFSSKVSFEHYSALNNEFLFSLFTLFLKFYMIKYSYMMKLIMEFVSATTILNQRKKRQQILALQSDSKFRANQLCVAVELDSAGLGISQRRAQR